EAEQFIGNERQLARFGSPRAADAPELHLAGYSEEDAEAPPFPQLVSPITGKPIDVALIEPVHADANDRRTTLAARVADAAGRVPMGGPEEPVAATVRVALGGVGQ